MSATGQSRWGVVRSLSVSFCLLIWIVTRAVIASPDDKETSVSTPTPPEKAEAGFRVYNDRVTIFVDAQLEVLRESGLWHGEPVGLVFLGITNRWEDAWDLTRTNFARGEPVVVVPTYNLPAKWMDLAAAVADHLRTGCPRTPLTTRKIGVPELLEHLAAKSVRVNRVGFSSGANYVFQENVPDLLRYAQQHSQKGQSQPPVRILVINSGAISDEAHIRPLQKAGFVVTQTGEKALVTAVQKRFADFDPTGLRIPALGVVGYLANVASKARKPFGEENRHGYAAFRNEVNALLVDTVAYNALVKGVANPNMGDHSIAVSKALDEIQARFDRQVAVGKALDQAQAKLGRQVAVGKALDQAQARLDCQAAVRKALDQAEAKLDRQKAIQRILNKADSETRRLATSLCQRQLIGFAVPVREGNVRQVLGVAEDAVRVVYQSPSWVEKQFGTTRWSTVGRVGSDEAFLLYNSTGQGQEAEEAEEAVAAVKRTLEKIEEGSSKRGVVLIGDPNDPEYQTLNREFEAAGVPVVGEVDEYDRSQYPPRRKSQDEKYRETDQVLRLTGAAAAVEVGKAKKVSTKDEGGDTFDSHHEEPHVGVEAEEIGVEVEKIDGGWKITISFNHVPIWEIIVDEEGNIIWQGPPGTYPGGYDDDGKPIIRAGFRKGDHDIDWRKPAPSLVWLHRSPALDQLAAMGMRPVRDGDFRFPPLCPPPDRKARLQSVVPDRSIRAAIEPPANQRPERLPASNRRVSGVERSASARVWLTAMVQESAGEEIRPGNRVVTIDDAPLMDRHNELGRVWKFTEHQAEEIRGDWVLITVEYEGNKISGWIERKHLIVLPRDQNALAQADPVDAIGYCSRAMIWNTEGKYDNAIADSTKAIELDPKHAVAYCNRGNAWFEKGDYDKAIADYTKAIELDPNPKDAVAYYNRAVAYCNRGNAWSRKGEYDKAIADSTKAIQLDPKYVSAYCCRADAFRLDIKFDEAVRDCTKAIEIDPQSASAYSSRGVAWEMKEEYDKAMADYDKAIKLDPKHAFAYGGRARCWAAKGQFDKAIADCARQIELDPLSGNPFYDRGNVRMHQGEYDKAIADFTKAIELDPHWACSYEQLAKAWIAQRRFDKAIQVTEKLLSIAPDAARSYLVRGSILYGVGKHDEAIAAFDKALKLDPNSVHAFTGRGAAWARKGNYRRAIRDFNRAVEVRPQYELVYSNRASAWNVSGDSYRFYRAMIDSCRALTMTPNDQRAYYNRAIAWGGWEPSGRLEEAIADYDETIRLVPRWEWAYYNRGTLKFATGNLDAAMADYDRLLELLPGLAEALAGRGAVHLARGNCNAAIAEYDKALKADAKCLAALLGRAAAKRARGDFPGASADSQTAERL